MRKTRVAVSIVFIIGLAFWLTERAKRTPVDQSTTGADATTPFHAGPSWPRLRNSAPHDADADWKPATLRFPDGAHARLSPDRVRVGWGRSVALTVERRDASGRPVTGILDMEMIVHTPGRPPFKVGVIERFGMPGTYRAVVFGKQLGIGRSKFQLVASQSGKPGQPGTLANAITDVEVVAGVRLTGQVEARWENDRLKLIVGVSTKRRAAVTIVGDLRAGGDVIAEVSGRGTVDEGRGKVVIDAGTGLAADDPRAARLKLADVTLTTHDAGTTRWTDFWRGARTVAQPQQRWSSR